MLAPPKKEASTRPSPTSANHSATRHLSAAAYLDPEFCLTALREIYCQPKRIVAPSYGFDLIVVLGHCLRAQRAMMVRDTSIVVLLLATSWVSGVAVLITLVFLWTFHIALEAGRVFQESMRYVRDEQQLSEALDAQVGRRTPGTQQTPRRSPSSHRQQRPRGYRRMWLTYIFLLVGSRVFGITLAYVAILVCLLVTMFVASLTWHADLLGILGWGIAQLVATVWLIGLVWLVAAASRAWSQLQLRAVVPDQAPRRPEMSPRLTEIERQTDGNTVVYSGFEPFVGSGEVIRRWDLAQRLVRAVPTIPGIPEPAAATVPEGKREFDKPPFSAQEITEHVREYIAELADHDKPEWRLPGLIVQDKVFVAGTEISNLQPKMAQDRIDEIIGNPTAPERHYLVCQVVSWRGELVTTVYVHLAVQGKALYVELQVTALPPCDERFRVVDQVDGTSAKRLLRHAWQGVLEAPVLVASAPIGLFRAYSDTRALRSAGSSADTRVTKGYDHGAEVGLRERAASPLRDHMQLQDISKYSRVIERRVLAAILDFLESQGVDVTEYRQRSMTILNAGAVAVGGGTVNVEGDAVGTLNNGTGGGDD